MCRPLSTHAHPISRGVPNNASLLSSRGAWDRHFLFLLFFIVVMKQFGLSGARTLGGGISYCLFLLFDDQAVIVMGQQLVIVSLQRLLDQLCHGYSEGEATWRIAI